MILLMITDHYLPFAMLFMQHWGIVKVNKHAENL